MTGLFVAAGFVHGLLDSTVFGSGLLRWTYVVIGGIGVAAVYVYRETVAAYFLPLHDYQVAQVARVGPGLTEIGLTAVGPAMRFVPGQFAMLFLEGKNGWRRHPFTMSGAPHDGILRFTIKSLGDDTTDIQHTVQPGMPAVVGGPHGRFLHTRHQRPDLDRRRHRHHPVPELVACPRAAPRARLRWSCRSRPIPVTACTTVGPPDRSAASSWASSSARPVNPRIRAGIVHTRRSTTVATAVVGADGCCCRGSALSACSNAVSNPPGLVTVAVVTPLPARRARNACWRAPCSRSPNIAAGPSVSSPRTKTSRGMPRSWAISCSNSV